MAYQDREAFLGMRDADTKRDIQLFPMKLSEAQEVKVTAKKSNVGRDKIMKVVAHASSSTNGRIRTR